MRRTLLVVALAFTLLLAGCSDGGDGTVRTDIPQDQLTSATGGSAVPPETAGQPSRSEVELGAVRGITESELSTHPGFAP